MSYKQVLKEAIHDTATQPPRIAVSFPVDLPLPDQTWRYSEKLFKKALYLEFLEETDIHRLYFYARYAQFFDGASQTHPVINANGDLTVKLLITLHSSPALSIFCICRALEESILCRGTIEMIQDMIYIKCSC